MADFGLAREFKTDPDQPEKSLQLTNKVITIWYRPPELLLGEGHYGPEVDMWSLGTILGELLLQKPLFSAEKEFQVLTIIFEEIGFPYNSQKTVDYYQSLPYWREFNRTITISSHQRNRVESAVTSQFGKSAWNLIKGLLEYRPDKRLPAAHCLEHPFFAEEPVPCEPTAIRLGSSFCHGLGMKEKREREISFSDIDAKRSRN